VVAEGGDGVARLRKTCGWGKGSAKETFGLGVDDEYTLGGSMGESTMGLVGNLLGQNDGNKTGPQPSLAAWGGKGEGGTYDVKRVVRFVFHRRTITAGQGGTRAIYTQRMGPRCSERVTRGEMTGPGDASRGGQGIHLGWRSQREKGLPGQGGLAGGPSG